MPSRTTHKQTFLPRHAEAPIRTALADTRIVAMVGPRQSGKTTLAKRIAAADNRPFVTLDDAQFRQFARSDPAGFIRSFPAAVVDEVTARPGPHSGAQENSR